MLYSVQKKENILTLVFRGEEKKKLYIEKTQTSLPYICTTITLPTPTALTTTFKTTVTEVAQKTVTLVTTLTTTAITMATSTITITTFITNKVTALVVLLFIVIGILTIIAVKHYLEKAN
jgi:predicted membrane channel-forming protein YqfA (hemolysin III family)